MSSGLYEKAKKKAEETAKIREVTDSCEIRNMTNEYLQEIMKDVGADLVDSLNIMGGDVQKAVLKGLLQGINSSHRYLQGEFWQLMLKLIKSYGDNIHFDARNEWAVQMCKRMAIAGEDPQTMDVLQKHIDDTKF